jgi:uncharacterized cupredoxin-like copper-binding protein
VERLQVRLATGAVCLVLALTGCGGDDERSGDVTIQGGETGTAGTSTAGTETAATETAPTGKAVESLDVSLTDFEINPANPSIAKTGVVEFKVENDGQVTHALEVEGPNGEVETETLQPGGSATLKADLSKAGSFTWYCPVGNHRDQGMEGKVSVAAGSSGGGGASEDETEPKTTEDSGGSAY